MLTNLLWFLEAKMQYQKQREQGLAGLMALLLVLFMAWKWESLFYPLFDKLGFVSLAAKMGLIHEEMGIYTTINIILVVFYLSLFFALALFLSTLIGSAFMVFGASNLGRNIIWGTLFIFLSPVFFMGMFFEKKRRQTTIEGQSTMHYVYSRDKQLKPLLTKYKDSSTHFRMYELYKEQSNREQCPVTFISKDEVKVLLNRAVTSIENERNWAFGYDRQNDQWHLLFPNPLPEYASTLAEYDDFKPYNSIFKYKECDVQQLLIEQGQATSTGFHVPALPIEFAWNTEEKRILPVVKEQAKMILFNTSNTAVIRLNQADTQDIFEEVSRRDDVMNWVRMAHVMVYFIPVAYPPETPFAAEKRYYHKVKNVPYVDTYYALYTADVEACKAYFEERGKDWHQEWFNKVG